MKRDKKLICQAFTRLPWDLGKIGNCSRRAKYKVFDIDTNKITYFCGIHIKEKYYNYSKKLMFPFYKITLIKKNEIENENKTKSM